MKKIYFSLLLSFLSLSLFAQTTYSSPGVYTYTAPVGGASIGVDMAGAQGGSSLSSAGGKGGRVQATLSVSSGQVLNIYVGGQGANYGGYCVSSTGGTNGGGNGMGYGGAGGGASDIRVGGTALGNRILVAAGGGGGGYNCGTTNGENGGDGGGLSGNNGSECGGANTCLGGTGGSSSGGGAGATCYSGTGAGSVGTGGSTTSYCYAGGGGGGYYGGGSGAYGGGGGGSSYTSGAGVSGGTTTSGYEPTNGYVTLTLLCTSVGSISGTTTVCVGSTTTLSGVSGTWYSTNTSVATVNSSTGVVSGVSAGTVTIIDSVSSPCGAVSARATVTVNPVPGAITGTAAGCPSATNSTLSCSPSGGSWSSSSAVVSINAGTGVVTDGASTGTATISYSLGNGCAVSTAVYTVNPNPNNITGTGTICGGTVPTTLTLSDGTSGGTWSSSNVSLATVGSSGSSTTVTGVAAGTPTITYMLGTGCIATTTVTVNAVANINGSPTICLGTTGTYTDATGGGSWSSSNPGVGSITSSGSGTATISGLSLGSTNVTYTVSSINCSALQAVNVSTSSPTMYAVTGGGSYCSGGSGVHVGLNGSNTGVTYYLFNGATQVATATGTGASIDFGPFTGSGTYNVTANYGLPCATNMAGSATISINSLPTAYSVSSGGSYCSGGSGVGITLNNSTIGVNYQLMFGSTPVGSPVVGTGGSLSFGSQTSAGSYTVVATNASTGCSSTMSGSATVSINSLPTAFSVTGGGGYCVGGSGVHVGLGGSVSGVSYQLQLSGASVGTALSGNGSSLDFGLITTAGTYTVLATNSSTGCTATMSGSATVTINSLPTAFTVTGGGSYCAGGTGVSVGLGGSSSGVNYQLYNGSTLVSGALVSGTGASITFGSQTSAGSYTVVATNVTTGCVNNMTSSVLVSVNPLPSSFNVTGGGSYCAGGTGLAVGLSGSVAGTSYSLYDNGTLVGGASGSGGALNFGLQLSAGTYTVNAQNTTTGCSGAMSGSVSITINPLPTPFTVSGGGNYCAGGAGVPVGMGGSTSGVNYQLYNGTSTAGAAVAGNGGTITFGPQTGAGAYTVIASNATTGCTNNMLGSAFVVVNPLPTVYAITGGGPYCAGGAGVHIGQAASNTGISYQLTNSGAAVGSALAGTGSALDFGVISTAGTYSVTATNPTTGCTTGMGGSTVITINTLPTPYNVTNGGPYCAGGTGVHVGLGNSASGVNYQLFNGVTAVGGPVAGSGGSLDFGLQTAAGTYSVVATNAATGCSNNMTGSVMVSINPVPAVFAVTGGGPFCAGGSGVHIGVGNSVSGISYTLMKGAATISTAGGTGSAVDFGLQTATGTYTVVASNPTTGCTSTMSGTAVVSSNPVPGPYTITGGGNYCAGGAGMPVGLNGSATGISYQLVNGVSSSGAPLPGNGSSLNFGAQSAGTYSVIATNTTTGCSATMLGTAIIGINPLPVQHNITGGGSFCAGGTGTLVGLDNSSTGTNYQLYNGSTPVGAPVTGSTGLALSFGMQVTPGIYTVIATNTATSCNTLMTGSATVAINPLPTVYNVTGGGNYCSGGAGAHVGLSSSASGVMYQLWDGGVPMGASVPGTGSSIDFGPQTVAGAYTVVARTVATACIDNMNGTVNVGINALPNAHNVTGGGAYCAGGSGSDVKLDGSDAGINYQLYNGSSAVGAPVSGTGSALDFGLQTAAGNYTVIASNTGTACTGTMTGSVNVSINTLPNQYTMVGGGGYCSGGTGADIQLLSSDPGVNYQLFDGTTLVGGPMAGSGSALDFGTQTTFGTYSIVATSLSTSCSSGMSNTVTISANPLPAAYIVSGGGSYCAGGAGVHVLLNGSATGVSYQLWVAGSQVGPAIAGTGSAIDFGAQSMAGAYSIKATNNATTCVNTMTGSAVVGINALPAVYTLNSSASSYCAGGSGVAVSLSNSDAGVNYQLYNAGTAVGSPVPGTGSSLNFGNQRAGGSYTAVATNSAGCSDNMGGIVNITVNPVPNSYNVSGGGSYCAGGTGSHIDLSGSQLGTSYQLFIGTLMVGSAVTGTSGPLDFGAQTTAGNYQVVATNTSSMCTSTMSGSAAISVSPLPIVYNVTGGGTYCAGTGGMHIGLNSSTLGVHYQLYRGVGSPVGPSVSGSGTSLDFGAQTVAGSYSVIATDGISGCTMTMAGVATIAVNAAPNAYTVIGGGNFCTGGTGVNVGINGSSSGISYQLYNGLTMSGSSLPGSGSAINFGLQTSAGTYTVLATNTTTGCTAEMTGSTAVVVDPLPSVYSVVGGGSFCAGGSGVHVGVANSGIGINYTLMNGFTTVATIGGSGSPLDFGLQTAPGTYTVYATNTLTGCTANMSGSAVVTVNPNVSPFVSVTTSGGTDTICAGSLITFTANGVNGGTAPAYQWSVNGVIAGSGTLYSYIPINGDVVNVSLTSNAPCASPSSSDASVTMTVNPSETPVVSISADPGTTVCQNTQVTFTANPTYGGGAPLYSWYKNGTNAGTTSGTYTITPANGDEIYCIMTSDYSCRLANTAASSRLTMEVDVPQTPVVNITANPGSTIAAGQSVTFTATVNNAGSNPTYQWMVNNSAITGATSNTYTTSDLLDGDVVSCQVISGGGCAGTPGSGSLSVHIRTAGVAQVSAGSGDIKLVPNPNKGTFVIKGTLGSNSDQDVTLEITDMLGKTIYTSRIVARNGEINEKIDVGSAVANGMYILTLHADTENDVFHMVVEQ